MQLCGRTNAINSEGITETKRVNSDVEAALMQWHLWDRILVDSVAAAGPGLNAHIRCRKPYLAITYGMHLSMAGWMPGCLVRQRADVKAAPGAKTKKIRFRRLKKNALLLLAMSSVSCMRVRILKKNGSRAELQCGGWRLTNSGLFTDF